MSKIADRLREYSYEDGDEEMDETLREIVEEMHMAAYRIDELETYLNKIVDYSENGGDEVSTCAKIAAIALEERYN